MHPVARNLLARKNKSVPVNDGRKIALVLCGGAMAGIQGAGAVIAFRKLGLTNAFEDIYASSAGFCNASYFLSENPQEGASLYYEDLSGRKFLNLRRIWDVEDVDYLIRCAQKKKPLHPRNILKHRTRLFAQLQNQRNKKTKFFEVHRYLLTYYFTLMKAAIKMPYLSPGSVNIGSSKFSDTLQDSYLFDLLKQAVLSPATDIVVVYNTKEQRNYLHKRCNMTILKNDVLEITPSASWEIGRLETRPEILKRACVDMGTSVMRMFGSKKKISLFYRRSLPDRPYRSRTL